MFSVETHLDELRSWPTERLHRGTTTVTRCAACSSRISTSCVASTSVARSTCRWVATVSPRGTLREKVETARALKSLPAIAATAHDGLLSEEQLTEVVKCADRESDAEWAEDLPRT